MIFSKKNSTPTQTILDVERQAEKGFQKFRTFKVISFFYIALAFLLPVFFVPVTADWFDLNKTFLTIFVAFIVLILYFIYLIQRKEFEVTSAKAYLPLLAILLAGGLSVAFSINKHISIYGFFKNYSSSSVLLLAFVILAFVGANVPLNFRTILKWFSVGVLLSTIVSILAYFGMPIPGADGIY